jgi:hypothetical protein
MFLLLSLKTNLKKNIESILSHGPLSLPVNYRWGQGKVELHAKSPLLGQKSYENVKGP